MSSSSLLELESQLEVLQSMLSKNLAYGLKLAQSLSKITSRRSENLRSLVSLREERIVSSPAAVFSNLQDKQAALLLYGHRIQGVPFYEFEDARHPDCYSVFQIISKKKRAPRVTVQRTTSTDERCNATLTDGQREIIEEFFKLAEKTHIHTVNNLTSFAKLIVLLFLAAKASAIELSSKSLSSIDVDWRSLAEFANTIMKQHQHLFVDGLDLFSAYQTMLRVLDENELEKVLRGSSIHPMSAETVRVIKRLTLDSLKIGKKATLSVLSGGRAWGEAEDKILRRAVEIFGIHRWGQVSTCLNGREHTEIVQRWIKQLNPSVDKGRWTIREDIAIAVAKEFFECRRTSEDAVGKSSSKSWWCSITTILKNRTEVQIRERWCNLIDPKIKFTAWTKAEDEKLLRLVEKFPSRGNASAGSGGGGWAMIARQLENKTDNQVLRRWKLLLSDRFNHEAMMKVLAKSQSIKKDMFRLIRLSPTLASLVRINNIQRKTKKKIKKTPAPTTTTAATSRKVRAKKVQLSSRMSPFPARSYCLSEEIYGGGGDALTSTFRDDQISSNDTDSSSCCQVQEQEEHEVTAAAVTGGGWLQNSQYTSFELEESFPDTHI